MWLPSVLRTSFRDFVEVFVQLSGCVFVFSTFVGLLPVRVFPFFFFFYAPTRVPGVFKLSCSTPFHLFLISSFCLPALSPIFHSKHYPHDACFQLLLAADLCLPSHSPVFVCITALFLYRTSLTLSLPWYSHSGWLGIKHQVTTLSFPVAIFHSVLVWCHSVLFCLGCCRLHSFVSFFSMGLFFGLCVFRGSVQFLAICRAVLTYLILFLGCSVRFLAICWAILTYLVLFLGLF